MLIISFLVVLISCDLPVYGLVIVPTENLNWTLNNANYGVFDPVTVPGGVYTDLMNIGILDKGDFYYRYNDLEYRWVGNEMWNYFTVFPVSQELADCERVVLEFDGLDTHASISLNTRPSFDASSNMFTRRILDVKSYTGSLNNVRLDLFFYSPLEKANSSYYDYQSTYGYEILPKCVDPAFQGECHANMIRKMQASFSWDWGPAFPSSGIWKPWKIIGFSTLKLNNLYFDSVPLTSLPDKPDPTLKPAWTVNYKVYFDLAANSKFSGMLSVILDGNEYVNTEVIVDPASFSNQQGFYEGSFYVDEGTVETWWPNGYGSQPLYNMTITFTSSLDHSSVTRNVGFRTVEFDESFVDLENEELGRHYRAKINNVFIFMKGSNWIPAHVLPERVPTTYTRQLLQDARDSHQNSIRVWGGGIYESDEFYSDCDQLGLLVWQDMMFACSMYPTDDSFLETVAEETRYQVQRLQHHPSLLLWATNNENEAALKGNWYGTNGNYEVYKSDYVKLYVDTIATILKDADVSRPTIISSPSNGIASEEDGYIAENPYDTRYGDTHYYNYIDNAWHWDNYPATRFASEYGFQSFPSYETFAPVLAPEDMYADSDMMHHRQHHPNGQVELKNQLQMHFDYDVTNTSFEDYLYLGQLHQAIAVKTETEFYRRMRSTMYADGSGLCMGALYWQLNDIWQGASWSSIEYGGRWKIAHNYAKEFFSPIIVVPWIDQSELKISVVSDLTEDYMLGDPGMLEVGIQLVKYKRDEDGISQRTESSFIQMSSIPSQAAEIVLTKDLENDLEVANFCSPADGTFDPYDNCFILVELFDQDGTQIAPRNFVLLGEPKNTFLPAVEIDVTVQEISDQELTLKVSADRLALFVYLSSPYQGVFSMNGFIINWHQTRTITFSARETVSAADFLGTLTVKSLTNSYDSLQ